MTCTKCGIDLPYDSRFCFSCGQTLGVVSVGGGAAAALAPYPTPAPIQAPEPHVNHAIRSGLGILLLVVLFGAAWYAQAHSSNSLPKVDGAQVTQPE
ncbi:MAG: hypothetical protein ABR880_17565 [Candidatus Sulfotelmatobacter sp.]|jgi:hypothetical protein